MRLPALRALALATLLSLVIAGLLGKTRKNSGSISANQSLSVRSKSRGSSSHASLFPHTIYDVLGFRNNATSTSSSSDDESMLLTIVCQLSGELGNNIGKFVHAYVLWLKLTHAARQQQHADDSTTTPPSFRYQIILRHSLYNTWTKGRDDAKQCFPTSLGQFNFKLGNRPEVDILLAEQDSRGWMNLFDGVNEAPKKVDGALDHFVRVATDHRLTAKRQRQVQESAAASANSPVQLPFLWSDSMAVHPDFVEFVDEYYHDIRRLLQFDNSCCAQKPFPDESVFHFRNFVKEMPRAGIHLGFEEMGPKQTARDLFGHLKSGDKVAILSRFNSTADVNPFLRVLTNRGLKVRFISGQTGMQDFCFLMSAQKEVIGPGRSTYFFWASILGTAKKIRSYWIDTPETRRANGGGFRVNYVWKTNELRDRFKFELYAINRGLG